MINGNSTSDCSKEVTDKNTNLLNIALTPENLCLAWTLVKANKGLYGINQEDIVEYPSWEKQKWPAIRQKLEC